MAQMSEQARAAKRAYMQDYWERKAKGQLKRTYTRTDDDQSDEERIHMLTAENEALARTVAALETRVETYKELIGILKRKQHSNDEQ